MAHSALVVAYVKCREIQLALQALELMLKNELFSSDSHHARISFNVLLSAMDPEDPESKHRVQKVTTNRWN